MIEAGPPATPGDGAGNLPEDAIAWPPHKASMHIDHNQHLAFYETVEQALERNTYDRTDFPDEAEIAKAIATGEVWTIQWYPDTPGGFCRVSAATLSRALAVTKDDR